MKTRNPEYLYPLLFIPILSLPLFLIDFQSGVIFPLHLTMFFGQKSVSVKIAHDQGRPDSLAIVPELEPKRFFASRLIDYIGRMLGKE